MGTQSIPELGNQDIAVMLAALARGNDRVQPVVLSDRTVWIKRYARTGVRPAARLQWLASRLTGKVMLRPSPLLNAVESVDREVRQMSAFSQAGFLTPQILYRSRTALVLSDLGRPITTQMRALQNGDPAAHDALLIRCALELGRLHAAGLCHGRPHPRDFFLENDQFGFLDFEEEPAAVMPLEDAQARDVWLLFLQIASRCLLPQTPENAYAAWQSSAPAASQAELKAMMPVLAGYLPLARLLVRIRPGKDIQRFIKATDFLKGATASQAVQTPGGYADTFILPHQGMTE